MSTEPRAPSAPALVKRPPSLNQLLDDFGSAWYECCDGMGCEKEDVARRAIKGYIRTYYQRKTKA